MFWNWQTDGGGFANRRFFEFTVKTDNSGTSNSDQFTVPTVLGGTYSCNVDWGDGSANEHFTAYNDSGWTHTFAGGAGTYTIRIWGTFIGWAFNNSGDESKLTGILQVGAFDHGNEDGAFYGCDNLTSIAATDKPLIKNGSTDIVSFFRDCGITSVDWSLYDFTTIEDGTNCLNGVTLTQANLDSLLSYLEADIASLQSSVTFHFGSGVYSLGDSETTIYNLVNDKSWTITSGGCVIPNQVFWIDAKDSSTITEAASVISAIADKSLLNYDLSIGSAEYDEDDPSYPVIQFNGTSDYFVRTTPTEINNWTAARTFIMVVKVPSTPVGYLWQTEVSGSSFRDEQVYFDNATNVVTFFGNHSTTPTVILTGTQPSAGFHIITIQIDTPANNRAVELFENNVSEDSAASMGDSNLDPNRFYIGADADGGGFNTPGDFTNSGIAEFRIYNRLLTSDELDDVHAVLNSKWGIS